MQNKINFGKKFYCGFKKFVLSFWDGVRYTLIEMQIVKWFWSSHIVYKLTMDSLQDIWFWGTIWQRKNLLLFLSKTFLSSTGHRKSLRWRKLIWIFILASGCWSQVLPAVERVQPFPWWPVWKNRNQNRGESRRTCWWAGWNHLLDALGDQLDLIFSGEKDIDTALKDAQANGEKAMAEARNS